VAADNRLHPRLRIDARADVIGREVILGFPLEDISLGGCRLAGPGWEPTGSAVEMVISFPGLGSASFPVTGLVVRSTEADMGIRFHELTNEQKWTLRKHIRELQQTGD
jgi:hypothetical protein